MRDANNTFALATGGSGGSGRYFVGGREARPVAPAADEPLQERLWALWEEQTGQAFRL